MKRNETSVGQHVAWTTMFGNTMCGFVMFLGYDRAEVKAPNGRVTVGYDRLRPCTLEDTEAQAEYFARMRS